MLVTLYCSFLCRNVRRKSQWFGTTPPTNKLSARPCLHVLRNSSDLIWSHPRFDMWISDWTHWPSWHRKSEFFFLNVFTASLLWTYSHFRAIVFDTEMRDYLAYKITVHGFSGAANTPKQELFVVLKDGCCIEKVNSSCEFKYFVNVWCTDLYVEPWNVSRLPLEMTTSHRSRLHFVLNIFNFIME